MKHLKSISVEIFSLLNFRISHMGSEQFRSCPRFYVTLKGMQGQAHSARSIQSSTQDNISGD